MHAGIVRRGAEIRQAQEPVMSGVGLLLGYFLLHHSAVVAYYTRMM